LYFEIYFTARREAGWVLWWSCDGYQYTHWIFFTKERPRMDENVLCDFLFLLIVVFTRS